MKLATQGEGEVREGDDETLVEGSGHFGGDRKLKVGKQAGTQRQEEGQLEHWQREVITGEAIGVKQQPNLNSIMRNFVTL